MRDGYKDTAYIEGFLDNHDARITKFERAAEALIAERGPDGEGVYTLVNYLEVLYFNKLIALYSAGRPLDEIRGFLPEVVGIMERAYTPSVNRNMDYYNECLWLMSIGIMLDIEEGLMNRIKRIAKIYQDHDKLMDFLMNGSVSGKSHFLMDRPYAKLANVLMASDKDTSVMHLAQYLQNDWYPAHEGTGWHDTHAIDDFVYRGYWSFESGAIVKILDLNDSSLKDVPYYPYDMVHYRG
ncbi:MULTISPECIES: PoNe immunity protein domain-containing protein [Bhargavaea]|uniref:PoNe immunity protein domain-containing protein n=1 Tax=Bhargavaea changchunensis TaxID=2134037 RepID=A0ABW2NES0_9BACL|nr:PoNe immunity protein domain-containing protein [Bhargavaea sp. CC-171006]